jgi:sugar lactone lactonase YvrE
VPVSFTFRDAARPATGVQLGPLTDPAIGDDGTVYWVDSTAGRILAVHDGQIRTIAGSSRVNQGFAGDGGDARAARLGFPTNVLVRDGDLLIVENTNQVIRRVDLDTGRIDTIAGRVPTPVTTPPCRPLDEFLIDGFGGACATAHPGSDDASLDDPVAITLDDAGNVIVTERRSTRIRRIDVDSGTISAPLLGGPRVPPDTLGVATSVDTLTSPGSIAFDPRGRLHVFEWGVSVDTGFGPGPSLLVGQTTTTALLLRLDDDGALVRVAGGGSGGDGPAREARLQAPNDLAFIGDDDAVFIEAGAVRRLRGDTITTVALPEGITGISSLAVDANGEAIVVDDTLSRVLRIADDDTVTTIADRSADPGLSFFYETMATSAGVVHVLDLADTSGGNFSTFDIAILRVDGATLAPVDFDDTALAADLDTNTFVVTGLIDEASDGGVELTLVRHAAHEVRRYRADGTSARIAGNGREPCRVGPRDDDGNAGPECDNDGDGLTAPDEVDAPIGNIADANAPLRFSTRINVTFPGVDDLDPRTATPRRASRQVVLQQTALARAPDGALVFGEQPGVAIGVRPGVPSAPLLENAARLRRLENGRLRAIVGPVHPPGPGLAVADAALYNARALVVLPDGAILAGGDEGRLVHIDDAVVVVAGGGDVASEVPGLTAAADLALPGLITGLARQENLLLIAGHEPADDDDAIIDGFADDARALCPPGRAGSGTLVLLTLDDLSDPDSWRLVQRDSGLDPLCGVTATDVAGRFAVAHRDQHCVTSWSADDGVGPALAGTCGEAGRFGDFLNHPGAVVARGDRLFVADLGNARLVRVDNGDPRTATVIVGADAVTALDFDLVAGQLAFDRFDNLGVASLTVVRQLQGVLDDDDDNDVLRTIYGQERGAFPEVSSFCLAGLDNDRDAAGGFVVSDACQRFLVRLLP